FALDNLLNYNAHNLLHGKVLPYFLAQFPITLFLFDRLDKALDNFHTTLSLNVVQARPVNWKKLKMAQYPCLANGLKCPLHYWCEWSITLSDLLNLLVPKFRQFLNHESLLTSLRQGLAVKLRVNLLQRSYSLYC